MKNRYEVRGDTTAIILLYKNVVMETLIDTMDLPTLVTFGGVWRALWSERYKQFLCYQTRGLEDGKSTSVYLHRLLMDAQKGFDVDHRNHRTLDNRRSNLRVVTHAQNQQNRKGPRAGGASGVRGVRWRGEQRKWQARGVLNGCEHYLGSFDTKEEAEAAVIFWRAKNMPFSETDAQKAAEMGSGWTPRRSPRMKTGDKNALRFLSEIDRSEVTAEDCAASISKRKYPAVAGCPTTTGGWLKRLNRLTALGWVRCDLGAGRKSNLYGLSEAGLTWLKSQPAASGNWVGVTQYGTPQLEAQQVHT